MSFLEALAHKTPIISGENPDHLTSTYGFHVENEDYESGLEWLLDSDNWRKKGELGRQHVSEVYEMDHVVDQHIQKYEEVLSE